MFSVFPGLSRSGLTISAGLFSRVNPRAAFQFSFLLSLPAVFGANLLELKNITTIENYTALFIGILCSFGFGLLALKILRDLVHRKFHFFGIYCLVFSIVLLLLQ
jgi:undecaprenyl-diphosphatase